MQSHLQQIWHLCHRVDREPSREGLGVSSTTQRKMVVMDRRKILLVLAAVIAALGTLLVFLYVQGADDRAKKDIEAVEILTAVETIEPGETFDDAAAAGKFEPV